MNKREKVIIEKLDRNCRMNLKELSKILFLSKQSIYNRIRSLENREIIKAHISVIDKYKLGYENLYLFLKISGLSLADNQQKQTLIKNIHGVTSVTNFFGDFDVGISIYYRCLTELTSILNKIYRIFGKSIENKELHFTKRHIIQSMVFEDKTPRKTFIKETVQEPSVKLTSQEKEILKKLEFNGRANYVELADELKISANTVKYHIKKLEKSGVILGYKTNLDYTKLGYLWNICLLETFPGKDISPILDFFEMNKKIPFISVDINDNLAFDYLSEDYMSLKNFLIGLKIKYNNIVKRYTVLNVSSLIR